MGAGATLLGAGAFIAGLGGGILVGRRWGIPMLSRDSEYSIAIYEGASIDQLVPKRADRAPVLTANDVTDLPARFVADPFLLPRPNGWSLFFEVMDRRNERGCIGHAVSADGGEWTYQGIVLSEPYHLSYPFVFEWDGETYMVPESSERYEVRLYRATSGLERWEPVTTLLHGAFVDSTLFRRDGRWWMFAGTGWGYLHLFQADALTGPWVEHPASPLVVGNPGKARPGGRVIDQQGALLRMAQDDVPYYGRGLRAFQIDELSPLRYVEHELPASPLFGPGQDGWNKQGMHHLDAHQLPNGRWIAAVDGFTSVLLINRHKIGAGRLPILGVL